MAKRLVILLSISRVTEHFHQLMVSIIMNVLVARFRVRSIAMLSSHFQDQVLLRLAMKLLCLSLKTKVLGIHSAIELLRMHSVSMESA